MKLIDKIPSFGLQTLLGVLISFTKSCGADSIDFAAEDGVLGAEECILEDEDSDDDDDADDNDKAVNEEDGLDEDNDDLDEVEDVLDEDKYDFEEDDGCLLLL